MTNTNYEQMAKDIYDWCMAHEAWQDVIIYFNGKAWSSHNEWEGESGKKIGERLYEYNEKNPCNYFQYGNPDTLSMSFEGELYNILNNYWEFEFMVDWFEDFQTIFDKYDSYYEQGHAWNLSVYPN